MTQALGRLSLVAQRALQAGSESLGKRLFSFSFVLSSSASSDPAQCCPLPQMSSRVQFGARQRFLNFSSLGVQLKLVLSLPGAGQAALVPV